MVVPLEPTFALDLWTLFVDYVFGGFWLSVFGMTLVMFIIMGFLGRISIFSCSWYCTMFVLCMSLGYGYVTVNMILSLSMIVAFMFSLKGYIERGGQ